MHPIEEERDPLQKQLANIEQIFQEFADQYDAAAQSLRYGLVPDPIPSIQLEAARKVVSDTFAAISEAGEAFEMAPLDADTSLSVAGEYLERILEARARAERIRLKLEEARLIISEVEALHHVTNPEELARVKMAAEELSQELAAKNMEAAENLLSGDNPLSMFAAYARHRETLNDEEYDQVREAIQEHYGRSLLRDIDRGRVIFDEDAVTHSIEFMDSPTTLDDERVIIDDAGIVEEEEFQDTSHYDPISEIEIDDELLEEANIDVNEDNMPPLYADYDANDSEDTLLPFLEGDGMNFENDEMPEARVNSHNEEEEEEDEEKY